MSIMSKKRRKKKGKKFLFLFFVFAFLLASLSISVFNLLKKKVISGDLYIEIPKNANSKRVIQIFNEKGLLYPKEFYLPILRIYLILTGNFIQSGTYRFNESNTNLSILRAILTGKQRSIISVTFPEGIKITDFAHIVKEKLGVDSLSFIKETKKQKYRIAVGIDCTNIEGYLHPDTYYFYYKENPSVIVERLIEKQNKIWKNKFEKLAQQKGFSRHFVLTLASIIEAESPLPSEKPIISGVYFNRLRARMRLESDPTVQYALGGTKKKLTFADLKVDSPYNTYLNEGLPPTPINSPSISSIEAVFEPSKNNYFFFVAMGDGSGRHYFAKTYAEHLKLKHKFKVTKKLNSLKK